MNVMKSFSHLLRGNAENEKKLDHHENRIQKGDYLESTDKAVELSKKAIEKVDTSIAQSLDTSHDIGFIPNIAQFNISEDVDTWTCLDRSLYLRPLLLPKETEKINTKSNFFKCLMMDERELRMHRHQDFEKSIFILQGSVQVRMDNRTYMLDDLTTPFIHIPRNKTHSIISKENSIFILKFVPPFGVNYETQELIDGLSVSNV